MEIFIEKHTEIISPIYPNWMLSEHKIDNNFVS